MPAVSGSPSGRRLPANPSLEQQRKRSRELLNALRTGDADALRRLREHHPRFSEGSAVSGSLALADAQLVVAREYGFPSWPKLKRHIETATGRQHPFVRETPWYEDRAQGMVTMHASGLPNVLALIRRHHPRFAGKSDDEIRSSEFTLEDSRLVYAREHGFTSWADFMAHVEALASGKAREPFMEAVDALREGNLERLRTLLRQDPALAYVHGTNGNALMNLATSFLPDKGKPAAERFKGLRLLLEAGADVNATNDRGYTALHSAGYGNDPALAEFLLEHGAEVDRVAHGDGGTPLAFALFWGHRELTEVLAPRGIVPRNLRVAAGTGRLDILRELFNEDGSLRPEAGMHRAFHRPHSGFPAWVPSDDPQEILDEALVWAAKSDRVEVMPFLVERGADVNADPYRGTPLAWAAAIGRPKAAQWLLEHGADVNKQATFGGPSHGEGVTALHLCAQNGNREMCELLVAAGADASIRDRLYDGPPSGWAAHGGHPELAERLKSRA